MNKGRMQMRTVKVLLLNTHLLLFFAWLNPQAVTKIAEEFAAASAPAERPPTLHFQQKLQHLLDETLQVDRWGRVDLMTLFCMHVVELAAVVDFGHGKLLN